MTGTGKLLAFSRRIGFLVSIISNDELNLEKILILSIALAKSRLAQPMIKILNSDADSRQMLLEYWRPQQVDLKFLMSLPSNSLGRGYAEHLVVNNIDVMLYNDDVQSDSDYIVHRLRETHDILHTLLGCGTDPEDELQTQAFCIFNLRSPLNLVLAVVLLFRLLQSDAPLNRALTSFIKGATQGINAKILFAFKFEDKWDLSIDEWRREAHIKL